MSRALGLIAALLLALILAYLSRFWLWPGPWPADGLFGLSWLGPGGDLLRGWLRGTPLSAYDLLLWGGLVFLVLTLVERLAARFRSDGH
jgi:hypothetical protein